ncbi:MAG: hypothetical protein ACLFM3_07225 [Desulfohalobiaceae bacterium]
MAYDIEKGETEQRPVTREDFIFDKSKSDSGAGQGGSSLQRYLWVLICTGILLYHILAFDLPPHEAVFFTLPLVFFGALLALLWRGVQSLCKAGRPWQASDWLNAIAVGMLFWMFIARQLNAIMQIQGW